MNTAIAFLARHWDRLELDRFGALGDLSCVLLTPRFQASAHVVFLISTAARERPVLVIKASRLPGGSATLDREATNLRAVHALHANGIESIPRLLAHESYVGTRLLLETALEGREMKPALVRRRPERCADAIVSWLISLHLASAAREASTRSSFARLLTRPLAAFADRCPSLSQGKRLVERTLELTSPLCEHRVPLVFVHGDLSAPNLLLSPDGHLQVVDWELAEPRGFPAEDLFFALTYMAFARRRARTVQGHLAAFRDAFFKENAWTQPYVLRYADALGLPRDVLRPLFVACWARYVTGFAARLAVSGADYDPERGSASVRHNRFFALWRHTISHTAELTLTPKEVRT